MIKLRRHQLFAWWLLAWILFFTRFWAGAFFFDQQGNFWTTHINLWGDWAAHFTMGSMFAYRSLIPSESPFLSGAVFSYPFVTNWLSGILVRLGTPFVASFVIPSWVCSISIVVTLYYWFYVWLGTVKRAIAASALMLCTGGLGFIWLVRYQLSNASSLMDWLQLPFQATNLPERGIRWLSMVDSMIIPQRAFALGFPLALWCLSLAYRWLVLRQSAHFSQLIALGGLMGLLTLVHTHSFLAIGGILTGWLILRIWETYQAHLPIWKTIRPWLIVGFAALLTAVPLYVLFFAHQVGGFIKWAPGWLAPEFGLSLLDFWMRNWGPTLLLGISGILLTTKLPQAKWGWPFLIWFIVPNLLLFQPWNWDNTKLLIWGAVGISGFATFALAWLWQNKSLWIRLIVMTIFLISILSGLIDLYWIQRRDLHSYQMYTAEDWQLAAWVRTSTSPDSRWLTGAEHNHWLFNLTGRQTLMAYRGWLWTQGYDYTNTERIIQRQFAQPELKTLRELGVEYVVIGPEEQLIWGANREKFAQIANPIVQTTHTTIYKLR